MKCDTFCPGSGAECAGLQQLGPGSVAMAGKSVGLSHGEGSCPKPLRRVSHAHPGTAEATVGISGAVVQLQAHKGTGVPHLDLV